MKYQRILPPNHLKKSVRFFWTLDAEGMPQEYLLRLFACRYPCLIFQHDNGNSAVRANGKELPISYFSGLHSSNHTLTFSGNFSLTGVRFFPHIIKSIFGIDSYELRSDFPDLRSFTPHWLEERLMNTVSGSERIKIIGDFIYQMLNRNSRQDYFASQYLLAMDSMVAENSVPYLTRHFKISERQLERRFKQQIGFTPKEYLQITRFEKSVDLINNGRFDKLSDIAYSLGFYDQTHFIKEFKKYSGYTPLTFYKQTKQFEENTHMFAD